jgi:hypothetical protein
LRSIKGLIELNEVGTQMVEVFAIGCFVVVVAALSARIYERRLDVLYGGYVTPSFRQRWSAIVGLEEA